MKYYNLKTGEKVMVNVSKVHDGYLIERGTTITITSFPPKTRLIYHKDISPKGNQYSRFVVGLTDNNKIVRLLMTEVTK